MPLALKTRVADQQERIKIGELRGARQINLLSSERTPCLHANMFDVNDGSLSLIK